MEAFFFLLFIVLWTVEQNNNKKSSEKERKKTFFVLFGVWKVDWFFHWNLHMRSLLGGMNEPQRLGIWHKTSRETTTKKLSIVGLWLIVNFKQQKVSTTTVEFY